MEAGCRRADVEVFASRDLEFGRHAAGLGTWRCRGMETWSLGGMRCASGRGGTWRCLPQELRSSGCALQLCRRGGIDVLAKERPAQGGLKWCGVES